MTETTAALNATTLGCSITCKDLDASLRFYRDGIGFAVGQTYERDGKVVAAVVTSGNCAIVLNQDDGKLGWDRIKGQGFYLQINVAAPADVDAAAERVAAAGERAASVRTASSCAPTGPQYHCPFASFPGVALAFASDRSTVISCSSERRRAA
jgi:catechol 2,3-dioxygenase-like lactoylglutathione lyase family enzyme